MAKGTTVRGFAALGEVIGIKKSDKLTITLEPWSIGHMGKAWIETFNSGESAATRMEEKARSSGRGDTEIWQVTAMYEDKVVLYVEVHPTIKVFFERDMNACRLLDTIEKDDTLLYASGSLTRNRKVHEIPEDYTQRRKVGKLITIPYLVPLKTHSEIVRHLLDACNPSSISRLLKNYTDVCVTKFDGTVVYTAEQVVSLEFYEHVSEQNRTELGIDKSARNTQLEYYVNGVIKDAMEATRGEDVVVDYDFYYYVTSAGTLLVDVLCQNCREAVSRRILYRLENNVSKHYPMVKRVVVDTNSGMWRQVISKNYAHGGYVERYVDVIKSLKGEVSAVLYRRAMSK